MVNKLKGLVTKQDGQGMTEYGLVLGIIAIAVVSVIILLRDEIETIYRETLTAIQGR
jgi:pilus assembly protein Flp/PilA